LTVWGQAPSPARRCEAALILDFVGHKGQTYVSPN
jgi:hypothetical protein